jgi:hypothetical protein
MKTDIGMVHSKRRAWLAAVGALLLLVGVGVLLSRTAVTEEASTESAAAPVNGITVYKAPMCGCCTKWVEHLEHSGFNVEVITVDATQSVRDRLGVPHELASCHTAVAGDYWVEGHVPADLVQQLLRDRPEGIQGIAVPGMPAGSPGMESPNPVTYQVLSVDESSEVGIYATRKGGDVN